MKQETVQPPKITTGRGYSLPYTLYLHSVAWLLRRGVASISGTGQLFDKVLTLDTPNLGEGHVKISVRLSPNQDKTIPKPLILIAEGGGFILGQPTDGEHIIDHWLSDIGAVIISVDYAKAPRYPYPHALLQLYETVRWAVSEEASEALGVVIDPSRVAFMGNSAGGNLMASLTLLSSFSSGPCASFRQGLPQTFKIAAQVLLYPSVACNRPYLDRYNAAEEHVRAQSLPVWAASLMEYCYLPPYVDLQQIFIAPVDASVDLLRSLHLPPTMCITAGKDCLKLEAEEYVRKLQAAGTEAHIHEYPEAIHGFTHHKKDYQEDAGNCWERVRDFLTERLSM